MSDNGTGMESPAINTPSGAVTSQNTPKKKPYQGKTRSNINDQRALTRVDTNRHGIRRETTVNLRRTGRNKKG